MKFQLSKTEAFTKAVLLISMALTLIAMSPGFVAAQEDNWQFDLALYFWYSSVSSDLVSGNEIDVEADTLIDSVSSAFMGTVGVRKNRWSFLIDAIYVNLDDDNNVIVGSKAGLSVPAYLDVDLTSWIVTPVAGYRVVEDADFKLDILGGARYLNLEADINLNSSSQAPPIETSVSESVGFWDGIVGLRGEVALPAHLFIPFYLDIGTGESDLTWQAFGGIGYRFKKVDLVVAYRYLSWELKDNPIFDDYSMHGPLAGIRFRF